MIGRRFGHRNTKRRQKFRVCRRRKYSTENWSLKHVVGNARLGENELKNNGNEELLALSDFKPLAITVHLPDEKIQVRYTKRLRKKQLLTTLRVESRIRSKIHQIAGALLVSLYSRFQKLFEECTTSQNKVQHKSPLSNANSAHASARREAVGFLPSFAFVLIA